jgi:ABC-type transport system involved in multi-copper enzyme maturation permease subunit
MLLAIMVLLSVLLRSPIAASGAGIGVYAALMVLAQFAVTSDHSPAGLPAAGQALIRGEPAHWQWPLGTAVALTVACLVAAVWRFSRREI